MSVSINDFRVFVQFVANKNQNGGTVTTPQFNALCHRAQMAIFEKDRKIFLETGISSSFLDMFLRSVTTSPNPLTGYMPYPTGYQHVANVRSYYNKKERPVEQIANSAWGEINASQLMQPTKMFPKFCEYAGEVRFLPRNIGIVMFDYWKEPVKPVWGYTIVNNVQVYDPATSTDFEFDSYSVNRVAAEYLAFIGINLQAQQLAAFSQQFKAESNVVL